MKMNIFGIHNVKSRVNIFNFNPQKKLFKESESSKLAKISTRNKIRKKIKMITGVQQS